jgi:hypothetical protein
MTTRKALAAALLAGLLVPGLAEAQGGFGLGPRMSWVRGDLPSGSPSTRFIGATIRMSSSRRVALEAAMDFRSETTLDRLARLKERPVQGSLLLFLARSAFSPYVLGGFGMYSQTSETLGPTGLVTDTFTHKETGAHAGFGAEILVSRHAAFFADYRFRFVRFGTPEPGADPINVPGLGSLKLSHRGSMWTSGVAYYF